jgi:SAM-dependent methyltransferase
MEGGGDQPAELERHRAEHSLGAGAVSAAPAVYDCAVAWMRSFEIDGVTTTDTTNRTRLIEHYTPIAGKTFLDLGAADGYEARALALRGAARAIAVEGRQGPFELARAARDELGLGNHDVLQLDARRIDEAGLGVFDVVVCFGLLYHMQNPYNLLRRIRRVAGELLLLETHVAPERWDGLRELHLVLPRTLSTVELDGVLFDGLVFPYVGRHDVSKGSLDAPWTLWLTIPSLLRALVRAGFAVVDLHHEPDGSEPEAVAAAGRAVGFGHWNTKVWVVAVPHGKPGEVPEPRERIVRRGRDGLATRARRRLQLLRAR